MKTLGPIDREEIKVVRFDFSEELEADETITTTTVSCSLSSGADPDPPQVLVGAPQILGSQVLQRVQGRPVAAVYGLRALAVGNGGLRHVIAAQLVCN